MLLSSFSLVEELIHPQVKRLVWKFYQNTIKLSSNKNAYFCLLVLYGVKYPWYYFIVRSLSKYFSIFCMKTRITRQSHYVRVAVSIVDHIATNFHLLYMNYDAKASSLSFVIICFK